MIAESSALLEGTKRSQVMGSKCKEIVSGDEEEQWPSKKAKEKYCGGTTVKMGGVNLYKRCVSTRQNCLVYYLK